MRQRSFTSLRGLGHFLPCNDGAAARAEVALDRRRERPPQQILLAQRRLSHQPRSRKISQILEREYAADALDFKEIISQSPDDRKLLSEWLSAFAKRRSSGNKYHKNRRQRKPRKSKPRMKE